MSDANEKEIREIPIAQIDPFPNHPFKVKDDDDMMHLVESIAQNGLLTPIVVRKKYHKRFEVISGHRRLRAFELLGRETIPSEVLVLSKEEATLFMIDSNFQRTSILPSERAFAYKMRMEAIKEYKWRMNEGRIPVRNFEAINQFIESEGRRDGGHDVHHEKTRDKLGLMMGQSGRQISRYIRLTELIPELLNIVDNGKIGIVTAVELSYIGKEMQKEIFAKIDSEEVYPTHAQSIRMKKLDERGELSTGTINRILLESKPNQRERIVLQADKFENLFPRNLPISERENYMAAAMEHYARFLQRKARDYER